jgi:hypothetical protein
MTLPRPAPFKGAGPPAYPDPNGTREKAGISLLAIPTKVGIHFCHGYRPSPV